MPRKIKYNRGTMLFVRHTRTPSSYIRWMTPLPVTTLFKTYFWIHTYNKQHDIVYQQRLNACYLDRSQDLQLVNDFTGQFPFVTELK